MKEEIMIAEKSEKYIAYDCDKVFYVRIEKGGIISDHTHDYSETVFLMEGEAEMILGNKTSNIIAPMKLTIPPNTYHKFTAITNLIGLELKN